MGNQKETISHYNDPIITQKHEESHQGKLSEIFQLIESLAS